MDRPVSIAILLATVCLVPVLASAAPNPPHITLSNVINGKSYLTVEGTSSGEPDNCSDNRCGDYLVTVHDDANNPVNGANVTIDFSGCPDIQIACDQLTSLTGQTVSGPKHVTVFTNAMGQATFKVQGAANATYVPSGLSGGIPVATTCATVYVDGLAVTPNVVVSAYDVDGLGSPGMAVSGADAALVAHEVTIVALGAQGRARDDINYSGMVTGADAAIYARLVVQASLGTGTRNTAPYCP